MIDKIADTVLFYLFLQIGCMEKNACFWSVC